MDLEEINKRLKVEADSKNNQPLDDFEGRTSRENVLHSLPSFS
ncbi:MAG: hypothetical protein R2750_03325 [Bacteroidales bacterium]